MKWPESNDKLFLSGGINSFLGIQISWDFSSLANGYKNAGDILIKELSDIGRNDSLLDPIVFCYRHSLELRLKQIRNTISKFERGFSETQKEIQGHPLDESWRKISEYLIDNNLIDNKTNHDIVTKLVQEMNDIDKSSTGFRYPNLSNHQIDLLNLKKTMDGLDNYLSGLDDWLNDY